MNELILTQIITPFILGLVALALRRTRRFIPETLGVVGVALNLVYAALAYGKSMSVVFPWAGYGMELSFRLYGLSSFSMIAAAFFGLATAIYCLPFLRKRGFGTEFYSYLLFSIAFVNGALLADNLVVFLFFSEALLILNFAMIAAGGRKSFRTAIKAFVIVGIADLCMMAGVAIVYVLTGTFAMTSIKLSLFGPSSLAFVLIMIGAAAKGGCMPFHSWIPDAAEDAPLPFMAFFPASVDKVLGIYFLTKISTEMFTLGPDSWVSTLLMYVGSITIILAVLMALIQKEYKRLLSYHAISQLGYMILGIGTALPAGIVGGIFHMINNALYKSCLFFTGGAVEVEAGTTDLKSLGGLWRKMPVTFICFAITALSISGVPPFNGFFSKELVYDAALERGMIFYLAALIGSFFTAASFLKLGHAAFIAKPTSGEVKAKETSYIMIIPMVVIAALCIVFGVYNVLPIDRIIVPALSFESLLSGHHISGFPASAALVVISVVTLLAALANHIIGAKVYKGAVRAADHIRYAPILSTVFGWAERRLTDPYVIGRAFVRPLSRMLWGADKFIDFIYDGVTVNVSMVISRGVRLVHTGSYAVYMVWAALATFVVILFLVR